MAWRLDGAGNLYIADYENHRIRKMNAAGISPPWRATGRPATRGRRPGRGGATELPRDLALDGAGNLYIADGNNHRIRKMNAAGVISPVAGNGAAGYGGDGGAAVDAQLNRPYGVAADGAGNLYVADQTTSASAR